MCTVYLPGHFKTVANQRGSEGAETSVSPVGDCHRKGIGGVHGGGGGLQTKLEPDHFGDLALFATAIARDGLLHECGSVLGDLETRVGHAEKGCGARFAEGHCSAHVLANEAALDGARGGAALDGDGADFIAKVEQRSSLGSAGLVRKTPWRM